MTEQQPMKMAAAEALYDTEQPALVLAVHHRQPRRQPRGVRPPDPRPAVVPGHRRLRRHGPGHQRPAGRSTRSQYGPGDYTPDHPGHLLDASGCMIGFGMLAARRSRLLVALVAHRARAAPPTRQAGSLRAGAGRMPLLPLLANSFGWIFTEMGRQPWIVFGVMPHRATAVSPRRLASAEVLTSLIVFTAALRRPRRRRGRAAAALRQGRPARRHADLSPPTDGDDRTTPTRPMAFAY